jgi:biopolymer transport protein ExbB/TolQ
MYLENGTIIVLFITQLFMFSLLILKFYECFNLIKDKKILNRRVKDQLQVIDVQVKVIEQQDKELAEQRQLFQRLLETIEKRYNL